MREQELPLAVAGWVALLAGVQILGVAGAALAVAITVFLQLVFNAYHPPTVSSTLLIVLGTISRSPQSISGLAIGVILLAAFGEGARWARRRFPRCGVILRS